MKIKYARYALLGSAALAIGWTAAYRIPLTASLLFTVAIASIAFLAAGLYSLWSAARIYTSPHPDEGSLRDAMWLKVAGLIALIVSGVAGSFAIKLRLFDALRNAMGPLQRLIGNIPSWYIHAFLYFASFSLAIVAIVFSISFSRKRARKRFM